ncbi:MAG: OsmC family protein [Bacteroidales bacterium]|nr:OsmC family protein [Bacteroidales bacterium]
MELGINLKWKSNLTFTANVDGHEVIVDSQKEDELSNGPSPKKLLMVSLAGCTAMDVVSILNKMRVNFTNFSVNVIAQVADDHPKKYQNILLEYILDTSPDNLEKVQKAIELSKDRYCGIWNTLAPSLPILYKVTLI